jgi:hypothetical protein
MGILAATWLSSALVTLDAPPGSTSPALGVLLLFAGGVLFIPALVATAGKFVPVAVLATAGLRFASTGLYEITSGGGWKTATGVIGLVLCAMAVYAAAAMALEDAQRRTILPVFRRGRGRESLTGNLRDQLRQLEREAGVREQL